MQILHDSRLTLRLALPLMIGQLSQMLLGVADTLMIGHLGVTELAALTFANSLFHVPFVFGMGLLTAISVATSNARGANDPARARTSCRHGIYLSAAIGLLLFAISWFVSMRLDVFGQPPEVTARTPVFFRILMASMVPALASIALKNHADALNRPWPPFWIFLGGVILNIFLNWVLIFGKLGSPPLGLEGAGWATLIARLAILVALAAWMVRTPRLHDWMPRHWLKKPDIGDLKHLLGLGMPASVQMLCEVSAFSVAGLMMGHIGQQAMASHQIAITLAATAFMIPLGLSMALTVRIGETHGAGNAHRLRPVALSGWLLVVAFALLTASCFLFFGEWMASLFTDDPGVIGLSAALLAIVGVFQLVDGLQVASSAMLRGLQDTRIPALMGFVSYWIIGLPVSAGLAFGLGLGARGVWSGLAAGLFAACVTLCPRLWGLTGSIIRRTRPAGASERPV